MGMLFLRKFGQFTQFLFLKTLGGNICPNFWVKPSLHTSDEIHTTGLRNNKIKSAFRNKFF
jgi:hypothetical protein